MYAKYVILRHSNGTTETAVSFFNRTEQHVTVTIAALKKLIDWMDFWDEHEIPWDEAIQIRDGNTDRLVRFCLGDRFITVNDRRHTPMQFDSWEFTQLIRRLI